MINQETKKLFTYDDFVLMHGGVNPIQFNKVVSALELLLTKFRFNINNLVFTNPPRPAWLAFFNITKKVAQVGLGFFEFIDRTILGLEKLSGRGS